MYIYKLDIIYRMTNDHITCFNIRKDDIYPKQSFLPSIYYDNN